MANSVDPDQMLLSSANVASDLGLHWLQRPICTNTLGYYGFIQIIFHTVQQTDTEHKVRI